MLLPAVASRFLSLSMAAGGHHLGEEGARGEEGAIERYLTIENGVHREESATEAEGAFTKLVAPLDMLQAASMFVEQRHEIQKWGNERPRRKQCPSKAAMLNDIVGRRRASPTDKAQPPCLPRLRVPACIRPSGLWSRKASRGAAVCGQEGATQTL